MHKIVSMHLESFVWIVKCTLNCIGIHVYILCGSEVGAVGENVSVVGRVVAGGEADVGGGVVVPVCKV